MARRCKDCIKVGVCEIYDIVQHNGHAIGCGSFIDTADVAPKSEVAREIFAEIELLISKYNLEPNYLVQHLEQDIAALKKKHTKGD